MKLLFTIIWIFLLPWNFSFESTKNNDSLNYNSSNPIVFDTRSDFDGLWINQDKKTRSITKCTINYKDKRYYVKVWGACVPADCEWEERSSEILETKVKKFDIIWDHGFAERSFTLEMIDERLKLTERSEYKDNSGRANFVLIEYFVKQ